MHAAGVVHCDIKPSNVLLTRGGQTRGGVALPGDFDGARQVDVSMTYNCICSYRFWGYISSRRGPKVLSEAEVQDHLLPHV